MSRSSRGLLADLPHGRRQHGQLPGAGDKWTKAVEPGAKAPNCGHTYTEPSLPKGNYTVAALTNWAVTWTANGQSGVINVPAVQTTETTRR